MSCKNCKKDKYIVNKFFGLCVECNNIRLHGSKFGKQNNKGLRNKRPNAKKSLFVELKRQEKASVRRLRADEEFYQKCFETSKHRCEECGKRLPTEFRDSEGNVNARWRYSHIVAKSIAPELRHDVENINHLCRRHHTQWDHGDRESMKIYEKNKKKFPRYF